MPWADYACPGCPGLVVRNHVFSASLGAKASAPLCPVCEIYMEPIPAANFDVKGDGQGDRGFQKFEITRLVPTRDGPRQITETVDSLHSLRRIERDSEQRYKDGEGEPIRVRGYSQDRSNVDQPLFGREGRIGDRSYDSGLTPAKSGKVDVRRHGTKKPKVAVARKAGRSPLPER